MVTEGRAMGGVLPEGCVELTRKVIVRDVAVPVYVDSSGWFRGHIGDSGWVERDRPVPGIPNPTWWAAHRTIKALAQDDDELWDMPRDGHDGYGRG